MITSNKNMSYLKKYVLEISLGYRYKRIYIKIRRFLREPLFQAYSYLLFIAFCLFLSYIVYNRVIRERLPLDINDPVSNIQLAIYSNILVINVCLWVIVLLHKCKDIWGKKTRVGYLSKKARKFQNFLIDVFLRPVSNIYIKLIYGTIPLFYEKFLLAVFMLFDTLPFKIKNIYFYTILVIPKVIVVTCFLLDVFVLECFFYFYKTMWLLLLPLILTFVQYVYLFVQVYAADRILEEMDESPEAFRGEITPEMLENILAQAEEEFKPRMQAQEKKQRRIMLSPWYMKIYYKLESHVRLFRYNMAAKTTESELYTYNMRTYASLHSLSDILNYFYDLRAEVGSYVNLVTRLGYIIGWSAVILKQGPFPLTKYYVDQILSNVHALVTFLWTYGTSY